MKVFTIPEDELERLLLSCASQNNCIDQDNNIKNSCICYQKYAKELTEELIPDEKGIG